MDIGGSSDGSSDYRWTYKVKTNSDGSIQRFKARLVARGFRQQAGIDYHETFSPVARFDSIRTILSIAASRNLKLQQFDIKTAFLHGELDETIFMKQPKGYEDGTKRVCRLNRSIYGLKQASRCWNNRFTTVLNRFGLFPTDTDPCVFISGDAETHLILTVHIDDGLIAAVNQELINKLLRELKAEFEITTSEISTYLGLQIERLKDGSIFIHQEVYTRKILKRFRMEEANAVVKAIAHEFP